MTVQFGGVDPVLERLIRIETKVDVVNSNSADHEARIRALETDNTPGGHMDHETRLRRLERSAWLLAGAAAAAGAAGGALGGSILGAG